MLHPTFASDNIIKWDRDTYVFALSRYVSFIYSINTLTSSRNQIAEQTSQFSRQHSLSNLSEPRYIINYSTSLWFFFFDKIIMVYFICSYFIPFYSQWKQNNNKIKTHHVKPNQAQSSHRPCRSWSPRLLICLTHWLPLSFLFFFLLNRILKGQRRLKEKD